MATDHKPKCEHFRLISYPSPDTPDQPYRLWPILQLALSLAFPKFLHSTLLVSLVK